MTDLEVRTKRFALAIIQLCTNLEKSLPAQILAKQVLRSGTSVGAQYREARQARSRKEFAAKLGGSLQELSETMYWLELLEEFQIAAQELIGPLIKEAGELRGIYCFHLKLGFLTTSVSR